MKHQGSCTASGSVRLVHPSARAGGFTLVECACALGIVAALLAMALPGLNDLLQHRRLEGASRQLEADLQHLRSEAVARQSALRIRFQHDEHASCYVVHAGPSGSCNCLAGDEPVCTPAGSALHQQRLKHADGLNLSANVGAMLVDPRLGTFSPAGSIQIESVAGRAIRHVVNILGRVRTCVPPGAQGVGLVARTACAS